MALWTPANITSNLWVEADSDSPFADMSGNGADFTAVSGRSLPSIESDVVNGRDVFRFNGSNQLMESATGLDIRDAHVFIVAKAADATNQRISSHRSGDSTTDRWYVWNDLHAWGDAIESFTASSDWHVYESIADGDSKEGLRTAVSDSTATDSNAQTHSHLRIGGGNTSSSISLAECDVYAVLKIPVGTPTADIERIQGYFAHRIGIQSDLPAGHPYKTEAPMVEVDAIVSAPSPLQSPETLVAVQSDAIASAPSPLADPSVVISVPVEAIVSAPSPLQSPAVLASVSTTIIATAPSPLGEPRARLINDWTNTIPPAAQIYYRAELRHAGGTVKLPISSWQATIQIDRASFLQAVVPAAESYIDDIVEAGLDSTFVIVRGVRVGDEDRELDMASVPLGQMPYQRGPNRSTVTLSGYGAIAFEAIDGEAPPSGTVRSLAEVQTLSTQGGTRVRAGIDWLLRPGLIAEAGGVQFNVSYINYYVNAANSFMDVGERPQ